MLYQYRRKIIIGIDLRMFQSLTRSPSMTKTSNVNRPLGELHSSSKEGYCAKELRLSQALQLLGKNIKTPRIRARLTIVKLLVHPVILRPTLQELDKYASSIAQP